MERLIVSVDWSKGKDCSGFALMCSKCKAIVGSGTVIPESDSISFPVPKICFRCGQQFKSVTVLKSI